ncbi:hypothetical protein KJ359_005545 [Pestalotiopsis sp. 9143b]|nr:hypothetical protein KJ359_005545 [Pestalotiopsis sp. 9143b]
MNDELFRPRGLYCLVMAYDTNSRIDQTPLDQDIGPGPFLPPAFDEQSPSSREKIRSNDGVAGASSFPVPAELIYFDAVDSPPGRGDAESDDSEGRNAKAGGSSFTNSLIKRAAAYNARQDLKSQVKFQRKNPTSLINTVLDPNAEFREKDVRKQEKRMAKQERKWEKEDRKAEKRQLKHPEKEPRERKVREGILYLMIINMPSVEEMNAAQAIVGSQ